jgi:hypothetical protein
MLTILEVFFAPPMAVARLGRSPIPLESFVWAEDATIHGAVKTVIRPAVSFELASDGSVRPYIPCEIRFRDEDHIRPVAPFFELHAVVEDSSGNIQEMPLTPTLLEQAGTSLSAVRYVVTAANRKAERRTGDPACGYSARLEVRGDDHSRTALLASSPTRFGTQPLVSIERPIHLGWFQAMRPIRTPEEALANLSVLRVRITPAHGEVYGPPEAIVGIPPLSSKPHEIVRPENRILNSRASWCQYDGSYDRFDNPEPSDTYDGADLPADGNRAWGVIDDTCDIVLEATVVAGGRRLHAAARVFVGPPDFAPDRRPFFSLVDDIADREELNPDLPASLDEVADLFQRVFETVSLFNLEAQRARTLNNNQSELGSNTTLHSTPPHFDQRSMTADDRPYARATADIGDAAAAGGGASVRFSLTDTANAVHKPLADIELLVDFLRTQGERVRTLLRPPWGIVEELSENATEDPTPEHRDPRVLRDRLHDMRMPPYMRDSDALPLALTRRQYRTVLDVLKRLEGQKAEKAVGGEATVAERSVTPLERYVARVVDREKSGQ